jgi:RNA polymerase sigma-70 factor, ECF subfamily
MDRAMKAVVPQAPVPFAVVGGALFRRAMRLLTNEAAAVRVVEELFVRFVVYGHARKLDERARWGWIYRVVTSHCLRQLDDAQLGGLVGEHIDRSGRQVFDIRALRDLDEATRNILALSALDGLTPDEIAEVLGLSRKVVLRGIARGVADVGTKAGPGTPSDAGAWPVHPSRLALDRDFNLHSEHTARCALCREISDEGTRLSDWFALKIAPTAGARAAAMVGLELERKASGPRWKRILWLSAGLISVASLALLVARPRAPDRALVPYAGLKGASRVKAAGIQITLRRGEEVRALEPGAALRPSDRLHFRVRAERARYLELRIRGMGDDVRIFPASGTSAALVRPGEALDRDYLVAAPITAAETQRPKSTPKSGQGLWIVALFADHPFPLDLPPGPDIEVAPVRVEVER